MNISIMVLLLQAIRNLGMEMMETGLDLGMAVMPLSLDGTDRKLRREQIICAT